MADAATMADAAAMIDAAVNVFNFVLQKIAEVKDRVTFDSEGLEDEVKSFQRALERINSFLDNPDGKRSDHENVKALVRQIAEVANEAEHAIHTLTVEVDKDKKRNFIGKVIYRYWHAQTLRTVAKKIESLNREINKIYEDIAKYGIERDEVRVDAEVLALHRRRRRVEEDDVVGFGGDCDKLVEQLITFKTQNSNLDVISIIGMGGLGKTTLARKIYNNDRIKSNFDCRVWVYVSQDFKIRELFLEILESQLSKSSLDNLKKKLKEKSEEHAIDVLEKKLLKCFRGKKYLVVLDDIWNTQDWNEVKNAFPDNSNGSRILITSRRKEVASGASPPHILQFLNKDESWELFHKKVFRGKECPPKLETLERQIAEGCGGLPLSIVVLGGLLANKEKTNRTWSKVIADVNCHLTECKDILALSYTYLPLRLKRCFLYFGAYPEDFKIPVKELIKLWTAEGFIEHTGGERNNEDVAEDYLEELIDRNLIQMCTLRSDGGVKHCRIHDLLRELCISKSAEENLLYVPRDDNSSSWNTSLRLSIQSRILPQFISSNTSDTSHVRSFLSFGSESGLKFEEIHWKWVHRNLKLLRVLHLELRADFIPKEIEILIYLRYLKVNLNTDVFKLPTSIGNLACLETLAIAYKIGGTTPSLPDSIMKLPLLRNLCCNLSLPNNFVTAPPKLQVLSVKTLYSKDIVRLIAGGKLPNIRKLGLLRDTVGKQNVDGWDIDGILASVHYLSHLQTLNISYFNGERIISLPNSFPETITKISLVGVGFDDSGMEVLGKLPKLWILKLQNCLSSCDLHIHAHSFPQLQSLQLVGASIKKWKQDKGAMPGLRHLVIIECFTLTMIRSELKSLTALQEVHLSMINKRLTNTFEKLKLELGFNLTYL